MNALSLMATLGLDSSEYEKGLGNASNDAHSFGSTIKKVFAGLAVAKLTSEAVKGIANITKAVVSAYADYQQLVGGVETLFGAGGKSLEEYAASVGKTVDDARNEYALLMGAQNTVMENAKEAYKTAGLDMNTYMETVTGFSASLIQSLGGDTLRAAELADQAIIDMSDNANKMGSSMESIQTAYQGFAKQNYTMLDNLKLGYGGTKTEMERLVKDAEKLDSSFEASRTKNGELTLSYADIVNAIHIVQTEMGITGTTAAEANLTISGSLNATKAAWENLLISFGTGSKEDVKVAMDALVETARNTVTNIVPIVITALGSIGEFLKGIIPVVTEELPTIIEEVLPVFLEAVGTLIIGIASALPGMLQAVWNVITSTFYSIKGWLEEKFPALTPIFEGVSETATGALGAIKSFWDNTLKPALQSIGDFLKYTLLPTFRNVWVNTIQPLVKGVFETLKTLWEDTLKPVFQAIGDFLIKTVGPKFDQVWSAVKEIVGKAFDVINSYWENVLKPVFQSIIDFIKDPLKAKFDEIWPKIQDVVNRVFNTIRSIWNTILKPAFNAIATFLSDTLYPAFKTVWEETIQPLVEAVFNAIVGFWNGILYPAFVAIDDFLNNTLLPVFQTVWKETIEPLISEVFNAISGFWNDILKPVFDTIISFINDTLTPAFNEGFDATIKVIVETVFNAIQGFWNDILKPTFEAIDSFLNDTLLPVFQSVWTDTIQPLVQTVFNAILGFWTDILYPVFMDIGTVLGNVQVTWNTVMNALSSVAETVFNAILGFWNAVLFPVFDAIGTTIWGLSESWNTIMSVLSSVAKDVFSSIKGFMDTYLVPVFNWLVDTFSPVFETVRGAIEALGSWISDVFSGNWSSAWDKIVTGFGDVWSTISDLLKAPINGVIDLINGMIGGIESAINSVIGAINKNLRIDVDFGKLPDWLGGASLGGIHWGANLKEVAWGRIPNLAEGGQIGNAQSAWVGEFQPELLTVQNGVATVTPLSNPYQGLEAALDHVISDKLDTIIEKIAEGKNVMLDKYTLVGAIAGDMNSELNRIAEWEGAGRA